MGKGGQAGKTSNKKLNMEPKARLNFADMTEEALALVNNALDSITKLAIAEKDLKEAKDSLPEYLKGKLDSDSDRKDRKAHLQRWTTAKAEALEKSNNVCTAYVVRFMSTEDITGGADIYHFNMEGFLQNIGVLEGAVDDLKKSQIRKVEGMLASVTDRYIDSVTRRKTGISDMEKALVTKEARILRNTSQEVVLALAYSFVDTGCFDWSKGRLIRHDFTKEAEA